MKNSVSSLINHENHRQSGVPKIFFLRRSDTDNTAVYFAKRNNGDYFGGVGAIYRVKPAAAPTSASGYTKPAAYYRICRRQDLERVVEHFDRYPLRTGKAASYAIWRQMVALKRDFRKPPREELEQLSAQLSACSPRNAKWMAT